MLRINDTAPNFTAETSQGVINFHEWIVTAGPFCFRHAEGFHACLYDRARLHAGWIGIQET